MTARDRAAMVRRLSRRFDYKTLGPELCWEIETAVVREVDRAVKAERKNRNVCIDCKTVLIPIPPVLCEHCYSVRGDEGMDTDDPRTIQTWRRA